MDNISWKAERLSGRQQKKFGVSKSTVHKDVTERLVKINPFLAARIRVVLDVNKAERHIRGGMATKEKYLHEREEQEVQ